MQRAPIQPHEVMVHRQPLRHMFESYRGGKRITHVHIKETYGHCGGIALALVLTMGALVMFKAKADPPVLQPGAPSEDGIQPTVIPGDNPQCSDLGNYLPASGDHSLKFDPPIAGTKTSTDGYLTVTVDKVYNDTFNGFTGQFSTGILTVTSTW